MKREPRPGTLSARMALSMSSAVPSLIHDVASKVLNGLAMTVVARRVPARRWVWRAVGPLIKAMRNPAPKQRQHLRRPMLAIDRRTPQF